MFLKASEINFEEIASRMRIRRLVGREGETLLAGLNLCEFSKLFAVMQIYFLGLTMQVELCRNYKSVLLSSHNASNS